MITTKYINAKQARGISEAMKDYPLIDRKTDFTAIDSFLEYLGYELMDAALKGNNHYKTTLSDNTVKKLDKITDFLKSEGYNVRYEKFDDFRSDPPYAVGELEISW